MNLFIFSFLYLLMMMFDLNDKHPVFLKYQDIIQEATSIELYQVANQPVAANNQDKSKSYFEDYEILKKMEVKDQENIKKIVLEKSNYIQDKKTCPMLATYAIKFNKKKNYISLVISDESCKKVVLFSSEKTLDKKYHDLAENNTLHSILKNWKPDK